MLEEVAPFSQRAHAGQSFLEHGILRLRIISEAIRFRPDREARAMDVLRCMLGSWGYQRIGERHRWPSDISDDHSPYEFSLALIQGEPELRFLVEAQPEIPSTQACWDAGWALSEALEAEFGASLDRLRAVEDLYRPSEESKGFAMWHAACVRAKGDVDLKVYLNPQIRGEDAATSTIRETLRRLGIAAAGDWLPRARPADRIKYFSLDLARSTRSRIKIYTIHPQGSLQDIEDAVRSASSYVPGLAAEFCAHMAGGEGPFNGLPVQTCLAFVEGSPIPEEATIHFPIRSYAPDDLTARERILSYLDDEDADVYRSVIDAFAHRPLHHGAGLQSYVSLRMQRGKHRLTIYLSTELYSSS